MFTFTFPSRYKSLMYLDSLHVLPRSISSSSFLGVIFCSCLQSTIITSLVRSWYIYVTQSNSFFTLFPSHGCPTLHFLFPFIFEKDLSPCFLLSVFHLGLYFICALGFSSERNPMIFSYYFWYISLNIVFKVHIFSYKCLKIIFHLSSTPLSIHHTFFLTICLLMDIEAVSKIKLVCIVLLKIRVCVNHCNIMSLALWGKIITMWIAELNGIANFNFFRNLQTDFHSHQQCRRVSFAQQSSSVCGHFIS